MSNKIRAVVIAVLMVPAVLVFVMDKTIVKANTATIEGFVLDSACAFTKNLQKPISPQCATACAKAGSPLVILTDDGNIYLPISKDTPATGQNAKLMPLAGQRVRATGKVYRRGGSRAIVVDKVETVAGGQ